MNELIEFVDHINNITSSILLKYYKGIELTEIESEVISDFYIAREEDKLKTIEDIPLTENKHLNIIIMNKKQVKKSIPTKLTLVPDQNTDSILEIEICNIEGKPFKTGDVVYSEIAKLIQSGTSLKDLFDFCIKKTEEKPLTIKNVIKLGVLNGVDASKQTPEEKYQSYKLAMKIEAGDADFVEKERTLITKGVGATWGIEVVGFTFDQLGIKF